MNKATVFVMGALAGALAGTLAALALAPSSGAETRSNVAKKAGAFAGNVGGLASDVAGNVKGAVPFGKTEEPNVDELREKIEAARQRIAAEAAAASEADAKKAE